MRTKLSWASGIAVAATFLTAMTSAAGSGAAAEESRPATVQIAPAVEFTSQPVVQEIPAPAEAPAEDIAAEASSLAELAAIQPEPGELSREMHCLAGAIYFEARGEPLKGQLAVGRVVVERARSDSFPDSYCAVVYQPKQFSFVRGGRMPSIRTKSEAWRNAVAIARIAHAGSWDSPTEGALFFHAQRVSPGWRRTRLASVGNHIFYR